MSPILVIWLIHPPSFSSIFLLTVVQKWFPQRGLLFSQRLYQVFLLKFSLLCLLFFHNTVAAIIFFCDYLVKVYLPPGLSWWLSGKEFPANADVGSIPGERNDNILQPSCLENPMDRGAWWATVHGVAKSQTWLTWLSRHMYKANNKKPNYIGNLHIHI